MKSNMGILPPFEEKIRSKRDRYNAYATRAQKDLTDYLAKMDFESIMAQTPV
jgi:methylenetetrahydrofolate--tRNA-(uracil-5-)-methyltransferase